MAEVVAHWDTLHVYAARIEEATRSGDQAAIKRAQQKYDDYMALMATADKVE